MKLYNIPSERRELYFKIIEVQSLIHPITLRLFFLEEHFPPNKLDAALRWLAYHNKTGHNFLLWFKDECHNSDLQMHKVLLQIVDNTRKLEAAFAGRNFKI